MKGRKERTESRLAAAASRLAAGPRKRQELEKLLSVKETCEILGSYSRRDVLRMLDCGELRGLWQQRGIRRHWSVPISAIKEFIERLHSNQDPWP